VAEYGSSLGFRCHKACNVIEKNFWEFPDQKRVLDIGRHDVLCKNPFPSTESLLCRAVVKDWFKEIEKL
jgi:hypothetical protein